MGCVNSKGEVDIGSRTFNVFNVNDSGEPLTPGKIEITETDLIFYPNNRDPLRWPMKCLRRYGFDDEQEVFSFESGRRCLTGAGVFAFQCNRAEELFNILQECIQNAGPAQQETMETNLASRSTPNSRPASISENPSTAVPALPQYQPNGGLTTGTVVQTVSNMPVPSPQQVVRGIHIAPQNRDDAVLPPLPQDIDVGHAVALANYVNEEVFSSNSPNSPTSPTQIHNYVNTPAGPQSDTERLRNSSDALSDVARPDSVVSVSSHTSSFAQQREKKSSLSSYTQQQMVMNNSRSSSTVVQSAQTSQESVIQRAREQFEMLDRAAVDDVFLFEQREDAQHMYMNVTPDVFPNGFHQSDTERCYANVPLGNKNGVGLADLSPTLPLLGVPPQDHQVNYIVLDLSKNGRGSSEQPTCSTAPVLGSFSEPNSPNARGSAGEGYTVIDFDRTVALSKSANPRLHDDDGSSRKTRHNSTITSPF